MRFRYCRSAWRTSFRSASSDVEADVEGDSGEEEVAGTGVTAALAGVATLDDTVRLVLTGPLTGGLSMEGIHPLLLLQVMMLL